MQPSAILRRRGVACKRHIIAEAVAGGTLTPADVAAMLGMTPHGVRKALHNVKRKR